MARHAKRWGEAVSGVKPDDDGSDDDHCPIIDRPLLVAGGQATPLFEPIDATLDHVAAGVDGFVEDPWATGSGRTSCALIAALWDRVRDPPAAQQLPTARIAVAFVGNETIWSRPGTSPSARSWDANPIQDRRQLRAVMTLSCRNDHRERSPLPITGHMELGRQPSPAAPESLVARVLDPLFSSARLG
jgi:hypothetical protein